MSLQTITLEEKQTALIVSHIKHPLVGSLKTELEKYGMRVFFSPAIPPSLKRYDLCFFINADSHFKKRVSDDIEKKTIYIFINKNHQNNWYSTHHNSSGYPKIVKINGDVIEKKDIERILWFSLSRSTETILTLTLAKQNRSAHVTDSERKPFPIHFNMRWFIFLLLTTVLFVHIAFFIPLALASYFTYRGGQELVQEHLPQAKAYLVKSKRASSFAKAIYRPVRPTYLFFSLSLFSDGVFDMNEKAGILVNTGSHLIEKAQVISELILKRDKSPAEITQVKSAFTGIREDLVDLEDAVSVLNQKIPTRFAFTKKIKNQLTYAADSLSKGRQLMPLLEKTLSSTTDQKYLILFANNMELRPGGGFIGSFGILHLSNFTVGDFEIYDVYDADGQLTAHIEPPKAIRTYLNQPHFFLRDSAFYPDFVTTYQQATFFLDKEMGLRDFSGGVLLTTSSVEELLNAFGSIYLQDYNEKVDSKNFYLKAQIYSEKGFFPGSIQKKSFLSSLMRQLFVQLNTVSPRQLLQGFRKSADEKQIVFYSEDPTIEEKINSLYWSGRVIEPRCSASLDNCIVDYLYPLDANVGVNKANFFVSRTFDLAISINKNGLLKHTFIAKYKNESPGNIFPGGVYRNYFQLMIPQDTVIDSVTKNGVTVEDYDDIKEQYHTIGFLAEVQPQAQMEIKVVYHAEHPFKNGRGVLQLIVQKQIGAQKNELNLSIDLPSNMYLLNQNFTPLVKDNNIRYNTVLSTDKIFFIELTKE